MIITDDTMPGVAEVGEDSVWVIGRLLGRDDLMVLWATCNANLEQAKSMAKAQCHRFHEIVVVDGKLAYRVWQKDQEQAA